MTYSWNLYGEREINLMIWKCCRNMYYIFTTVNLCEISSIFNSTSIYRNSNCDSAPCFQPFWWTEFESQGHFQFSPECCTTLLCTKIAYEPHFPYSLQYSFILQYWLLIQFCCPQKSINMFLWSVLGNLWGGVGITPKLKAGRHPGCNASQSQGRSRII